MNSINSTLVERLRILAKKQKEEQRLFVARWYDRHIVKLEELLSRDAARGRFRLKDFAPFNSLPEKEKIEVATEICQSGGLKYFYDDLDAPTDIWLRWDDGEVEE